MCAMLVIDGSRFLRDGKPHQIISGAMHYSRVHPELWADRLARLAAMGLNAVETYIPWNFHERRRGRYEFTGWADIARFTGLAEAAGLDVILRPGPYACGEWDFGGFPAWLMAEPGIRLRCSDPRYLAAVDAWFDELIPRLLPLQGTRGGPVLMMQVENEYGSYGDDRGYLEHLRDGLIKRGVDVPLFTSDGPGPDWLNSGTLDGVLATVNFGSRPADAFAALRAVRPDGPLMCMEYWHGWFDHWGEYHHVRPPEEAAGVLDEILAAGASVNLYMAHGGTNFGLWNGCNYDGGLQPTVTSYDYDAPVAESGELTAKFHAFREVIARYAPVPGGPLPETPARLAPCAVTVTEWASLRAQPAAFDPPAFAAMPLSFEELGADHGMVRYQGSVLVPPDGRHLALDGLADQATVLADGAVVTAAEDGRYPLTPRADGKRTAIEVLVENLGRINYGPRLGERKGVAGIRIAHRFVNGWDCAVLPLDDPGFTARLAFGAAAPGPASGPVLGRATITIATPADGFLALPGWEKGFAWLNGFLLGRYQAAGPQQTLYAPAPLWRKGHNEVVILELRKPAASIQIREIPDLGPVSQP
jgi:beta-galactosidase